MRLDRRERRSAPCNCCLAGKGCTIYYSDGTSAICKNTITNSLLNNEITISIVVLFVSS
ncbi:hypothetical protein HYC85_007652 [Camellia sinensis]|uniref:Uncharacterized protein n=1 Tax=Camellia sinensis TaxID=4442 RepID=A0A7J7HRV1_CAMSI|nr:hypothetical protein HYC85_007652 [Camellia sinensis]